MFKKGLALVIFIFSFSVLFAQTNTDVLPLSEIDKLIKDTDYDKALEELYKYMRANPDNFDNAQTRITKIMNVKNRYTELAQELLRMITEDPDNSEEIYKITYELEHLERNPTGKQLEFIRETRIAAQFIYFRKEFNRIQEETEALVKQKSYVAATAKAKSGFYLYQEAFFSEWNRDDVVKPVRTALTDIDSSLVQFSDIQKRLNDSVANFVKAVNSEKQDDISKAYQTVAAVFDDFAKIRNRVYSAGHTFKSTFEYLSSLTDEEQTDASFLPFVQRFTLGASDNPNTGIVGAIDTEWNELCDRMKNSVWQNLDKYVAEAERAVPNKLFYESTNSNQVFSFRSGLLPTVKRWSDLALQVNSFYKKLTPSLNEESVHFYDVASVFSYNILVNLNSLFTGKSDFEKQIDAIAKITQPVSPSDAELKKSDYSSRLLSAIKDVNFDEAEKNALNLATSKWGSEYVRLDKTKKRERFETAYQSFLDEMYEKSESTVAAGYITLCDYLKKCDDAYVQLTKADCEKAEEYFNGIQNEILEKYPAKALELSRNIQKQVDSHVAVIDRHISFMAGVKDENLFEQTVNVLKNDKAALLNYKTNSVELAAITQTQIQLAEKSRNEAELRYSQAEVALQSDNFDTARKRLQDSRTKYNESLSVSFSLELQEYSDTRLQALGERITQKENEIVVREVRDLKTRAKNEYYASNFEQAENLLNQAKSRWAVTNVEEDAEISNLLAVVNTALSMKVGRVILPSAPLYPEMSQILSIAAQYYADGEALLKRNRRADAENMLQSALEKLQELRLVYPLNQEAALLTLRIQKVLSPSEFDDMFRRKVDEAKINYKVKDKQQEAYTDLLDLYEINPSYPGLKNLIYNVELEIGIRQKPVDNSAAIKSTSLTKEAQKIVNNAGDDEDKLREALKKVDEAIVLNGNNNDAIRLKDKIQTEIGGKASVVLSSEDEIKYQRAIQELQKNNIITANALVEQLLQKRSNKNSPKILELQKKIKALL